MYKHLSILKFFFPLSLAILLVPLCLSAFTITASEDVSISAIVGSPVTPPGGGDGGGSFPTSVVFSGFAYPGAIVHAWKDGVPKATTIADTKAYFSITLDEVYSPNALYTLYAVDKENRQSLLLNYPVVVKTGYITQVSGIRFAPTIATDKTEVKAGDPIVVSGYAMPNANLELRIGAKGNRKFSLVSESDGTYYIIIPLIDFSRGEYTLYVQYENDKKISKVIQFTVGDINIFSVDLMANIPGDCNADQVINIVDFSVAAFWYGKPNPPRCVDTNNDGIINLIDFSILAFYWTG